jgi:hypothetical protein
MGSADHVLYSNFSNCTCALPGAPKNAKIQGLSEGIWGMPIKVCILGVTRRTEHLTDL